MKKAFGERLRQARAKSGKNQARIARKVGVSPSVWSRWESGNGQPSMYQMVRIHAVLCVSLDWLVLGIDVGSPLIQRLIILLMRIPERELVKMAEMLEVRFSL